MGRKETLFPPAVQVIPEKYAVSAIAVIIKKSTADSRSAPVIQRRNIKLTDRRIFGSGDLAVKIFARPVSIPDMSVSVEVGAEIFRQRHHLCKNF